MIKITALTEETSLDPSLIPEHGLSLYIETPGHKILFDAGASPAFAHNAKKLGIDLSKVDIAFLSHGHYDHGGGLGEFLQINQTAKVYVNSRVFGDYWAADGRYVGIDKSLASNKRIVLVPDELVIDDELCLYAYNNNVRSFPMGSFGLLKKQGDVLVEDDFLHEQYLRIRDDEGDVLISGCSHKGILNIINWCSPAPRCVVGGFHFMKIPMDTEGKAYLAAAAEKLAEYPARFITCHCTGEAQYAFLNDAMGGGLMRISTGASFEV